MPSLGIFRRSRKEEEPKIEEKTAAPAPPPPPEPAPAAGEMSAAPPRENADNASKTYLKAMPLRDLADLETIKNEVSGGNILILRITPLAHKSIEDVKRAVNDLYEFAEALGGDIARLGEERVVICPPKIRIWREKAPAQNEPLPTAA
ncbi:MAG: cell division protein SepF [Candidatus Bathyarchaeia archaeon]